MRDRIRVGRHFCAKDSGESVVDIGKTVWRLKRQIQLGRTLARPNAHGGNTLDRQSTTQKIAATGGVRATE